MKIIAAANGTLVLLVYALIQSCRSEESLCLHDLLIGSYNGSRNMWVVVFSCGLLFRSSLTFHSRLRVRHAHGYSLQVTPMAYNFRIDSCLGIVKRSAVFSGFCKYYNCAYQIVIKLVRIYFYEMIYTVLRGFFYALQALQTLASEDIASAIEPLCL